MAPRRRALTELFETVTHERPQTVRRGHRLRHRLPQLHRRPRGPAAGRGARSSRTACASRSASAGAGAPSAALVLHRRARGDRPDHGDGRGRGGPARRAGHRGTDQPAVAFRLLRDRLDHPLRVRRASSRPSCSAGTGAKARSTCIWCGRSPGRTTSSRAGPRFLTVMLAAAWLPQIILFLGLVGGRPRADGVPAGALARRPAISCRRRSRWRRTSTTLAMLTASFTTRRAYAVGVPRRSVRDHDAVHRRAGAGDRRARPASGSRCSTSPTSRCM